jgi:1-deoxy-D-xylulose-5-phosphate synthase
MSALPLGQAEIRRQGQDVALLAFGCMVPVAETVGSELSATVVNMRFVKPLDAGLILQLAATHRAFVTLEDNAIAGGAGSAVNELLLAHRLQNPVLNLGLADRFLEHGSREQLLTEAGLDAAGVRASIGDFLQAINLHSA